ncbi:MAG: hypothetical protein ACREH4_01575, partial [Vitreimonas sp.]
MARAILDCLFGADARAADQAVEAFALKLQSLRGKAGDKATELLAALELVDGGGRGGVGEAAATEGMQPAAPSQAPAPEATGTAAADGRDELHFSKPRESAFCLALHGLCVGLAGGAIAGSGGDAALEGGEESAQEAGEDAEDDEDSVETIARDFGDELGDDGVLAVEKAQAIATIARLLPLWRERKAPAGGDSREDLRLVAKVLLECLLDALPPRKIVEEEQQLKIENGEPRTRQRIVVNDRALIKRIRRLMRDLPYRFTLQPLAQPVSYRSTPEKERAGADGNEGRFELELIGYRRTNKFLDGFLQRTFEACDFRDYVKAVDAQQRVAWRINRPLLILAARLAGLARPRVRWTSDLESAVNAACLDKSRFKAWRDWILEHFYKPEPIASGRKRYVRPGELLDN